MGTKSSKCKPDSHRAKSMHVKAQLAHRITEPLAERGTPQSGAAALLSIPESKLSKLLRSQFGGFSLYGLPKCFTRLGYDVHIVIQPRRGKRSAGTLSVTFA